MPDTQPSRDDNGRVTLAIVQNEIKHLRSDVERWHTEMCRQLREGDDAIKEMLKDHEARLRTLEGSQGWNVWRDVGAFVTAIGAGLAGVFKN